MPRFDRFTCHWLLAGVAIAAPLSLAAAAPPSRATRLAIAPPPPRVASIDEVVASEEVFVSDLLDREAGDPSTRIYAFGSAGEVVATENAQTPGVWEGRVRDEATGRDGWLLAIATSVGPVVAYDHGDGAVVQAIPLDEGTMRIIRRPGAFPGCLGAIQPEGTVQEGGLAGSCDDGSIIDVLLKWTPIAQQEAGSVTAIRAIAEASVALANHVYAMSEVPVRMRAVGMGITESFSGDAQSGVLSALRTTDDGILDGVHAERDALGADLVALLTGEHPSYCGVAYLLGTDSPAWGFSVTVWDCAIGGLTFTHEVGHNQGCCHAPGDGGGCTSGGVFPYSVGNRFVGDSGEQWRTVMAYSPGTRWPRLSSPVVVHDGSPTGTADSDNARTIAETAATMANYRCSIPSADGPIQYESPIFASPTGGDAIEFMVPGLRPAAPDSVVVISVSGVADHDGTNELFSLRLNGRTFGMVFGATGSECRPAARDTLVPSTIFNEALALGPATGEHVLRFASTFAVGDDCVDSEIRFTVRYVIDPACGTTDSDGDGLPDGCDGCPQDPAKIAPGACGCGEVDLDADGNGTADCLEQCPADLSGDGEVGGADLSMMLEQWGSVGSGDLTGDGSINGADLAQLLEQWGACP